MKFKTESIFGVILGFFLGTFFTVWYLLFDSLFSLLGHTNTINALILLVTAIGVFFHFHFAKKQREDRLWEINKDYLLRLSKSLADAIDLTESYLDRYLDHKDGVNSDEIDTKKAADINFHFREITSDFLNVYRPLLDDKLIKNIENYRIQEKEIEQAFINDMIDEFDAYDSQCAAQKELQKELLLFIKKSSGV